MKQLLSKINKLSDERDRLLLTNLIESSTKPLKINYFSISLNTIEELKSLDLSLTSKQEITEGWNGKQVVKGYQTYLIIE
jgi:hypothetical protein